MARGLNEMYIWPGFLNFTAYVSGKKPNLCEPSLNLYTVLS